MLFPRWAAGQRAEYRLVHGRRQPLECPAGESAGHDLIVRDTLYIDGSVTKKFEEAGKKYVEFELLAVNQDGERSAFATATAELPSKK